MTTGWINGKSRMRSQRYLHHIDDWLISMAEKNPRNRRHNISKEIKDIVHSKYEEMTGRDAATGLSKELTPDQETNLSS